MTTAHPRLALGLVVGPVAFIAAWVVAGARTAGYSAVDDAISRIAAVGAPERASMTAAFLIYGASVLAGSLALRRSPLRGTWGLAATNATATIAVAATPLDRSDAVDALHGAAAAIGYLSLALLPIVAATSLRALGLVGAARASTALGTVSAVALIATTVSDANGLFQRIGLGAGDVWLIATGLVLARATAATDPKGASAAAEP